MSTAIHQALHINESVLTPNLQINMSSAKDQRMAAYANTLRGPGMGNFTARGNAFLPGGPVNGHHPGEAHMSTLANGLSGMNLHHAASFQSANRPNGNASQSFDATAAHNHQVFMGLQNLQPAHPYFIPGANQGPNTMTHSPGMYSPYVPNGYQYVPGLTDNSPIGRSWTSGVSASDVPNLLTPRRESLSSNEAEYPGTPLTGYGMFTNPQVMDRSPSGVFTSSATPSPSQMQYAPGMAPPIQKAAAAPTQAAMVICPMHIQVKLQQDPAIPPAIPAPNSPNKPLDRSLENKNGETNVYIRGLQPETKDEDLFQWGKRFGDIQSSKSIIDMKTDKCKGSVPVSCLIRPHCF